MKEFQHNAAETSNLETAMREVIEEECETKFSRFIALEIADRKEAETLSAARGSDRNVEERNKIIAKYSMTTDPRQGMLRISILSASGVPVGNAQRRLRAVIRAPDGKLHGTALVYNAQSPVFENFTAQILIADDTQPLAVFLEEYNPKFLDVSIAGVSDTGTNIMGAVLKLRDPHVGLSKVCSENLVYYEQGFAKLQALDPRNMKSSLPGDASFTVKWTLEVRELHVIGFCENCGRMKNRCDCH
jgi:hypothetical protein